MENKNIGLLVAVAVACLFLGLFGGHFLPSSPSSYSCNGGSVSGSAAGTPASEVQKFGSGNEVSNLGGNLVSGVSTTTIQNSVGSITGFFRTTATTTIDHSVAASCIEVKSPTGTLGYVIYNGGSLVTTTNQCQN